MHHHATGNAILPVRTEQHLGYIKMHQSKFNFCQCNVIEMDNVWNARETNGSNWSNVSRESSRGHIRNVLPFVFAQNNPKQSWRTVHKKLTCFHCFVFVSRTEQCRVTHTDLTQHFKKPTTALVTPLSPQLSLLMPIPSAIFPLTLIRTDWFELTLGSAPDTRANGCVKAQRFQIYYAPCIFCAFFNISKETFSQELQRRSFKDILQQQVPTVNNSWPYSTHRQRFHL